MPHQPPSKDPADADDNSDDTADDASARQSPAPPGMGKLIDLTV